MEKRLRFLEVGQERRDAGGVGLVCFRELDKEVLKPEARGVSEDRVKLIPGAPAIQVQVIVVKNRVILGHEAQGEARTEFHEEAREGVYGVLDLSGEDEVPDQDPLSGQFGLRG
jgi:hypothetical protein